MSSNIKSKTINALKMDAAMQSQMLNDKFKEKSQSNNKINNKQQLNGWMKNELETSIMKNSNMVKLIEQLDNHQSIKKNKINPKKEDSRRIKVNLMKLQDKRFSIDKNIYNLSIGEIMSEEKYINSLREEAAWLKNKIQLIEFENAQKQQYRKQLTFVQKNQTESKFGRRSLCGKIYKKSEISEPKYSTLKFRDQSEKPSTYYRWNPSVKRNGYIQNKSIKASTEKNHQEFSSRNFNKPDFDLSNPQKQIRPQSTYQMKKTNKNRIRKTNVLKIDQNYQGSTKTEFYQAKKPQSIQQNTSQNKVKQTKQQFIQISQNLNFTLGKQVQVNSNPNNQLENNSMTQINEITDNFRVIIASKLNIPVGFPIAKPTVYDTIQDSHQAARRAYLLFNINIDSQAMKGKFFLRKYKNGLYLQLEPDNNIIWYYDGTFYFGSWSMSLSNEGVKNGFGFEYVPQKYYYKGEFKDGKRHGKGVMKVILYNANKNDEFLGYDGQWNDGKPHGYGKQIQESGLKYIGTFCDGKKTGFGKLLTPDGIYYEGQLQNGVKEGKGLEKLLNGDIYEGEFQQNQFQGFGKYIWKNGSAYTGQFKKGKRQGKGEWKSPNGDQYKGNYRENQKDGYGVFRWANGEIYDGYFKNDLKDGEGYYKYPSGKVGKFLWKQDKIVHKLYCHQEETYRCKSKIEANKL